MPGRAIHDRGSIHAYAIHDAQRQFIKRHGTRHRTVPCLQNPRRGIVRSRGAFYRVSKGEHISWRYFALTGKAIYFAFAKCDIPRYARCEMIFVLSLARSAYRIEDISPELSSDIARSKNEYRCGAERRSAGGKSLIRPPAQRLFSSCLRRRGRRGRSLCGSARRGRSRRISRRRGPHRGRRGRADQILLTPPRR